MINFELNDICDCGRPRAKRHCVKCGSASGYALSKKANLPNPNTGIFEDVNVYRCRNCNSFYNDFDRMNNCNAPERMTVKDSKEAAKHALAAEYMARVKRGEKLDHIDQLKFRGAVGMTYEAFLQLTNAALKAAGVSMPVDTPIEKVGMNREITLSTEEVEQMKKQAVDYQTKQNEYKDLIERAKNYKPTPPPPNSTEGFK